MAFEAKSTGKKYNSKFRANRADKAAQDGMASQRDPGPRAQAGAVEGKPARTAPGGAEGAGDGGGPVNEQGFGMPARAKEVHITHDHANNRHTVQAVMEDGSVQQSEHGSADEAHMAGAAAGGVNPEGQYPQKHKPPKAENPPDADDYDVTPLD